MSSQSMQFGRSEVLRFDTVLEGLWTLGLGPSAPSGRENLEARVGNSSLFGTWMDSKDACLYGGMDDDGRYRFKEDFSFDWSTITPGDVNADGSVPITKERYNQSQGTEFILIGKEELVGGIDVYAISSKGYDAVKSALNAARSQGKKFSVDELIKVGGFKVTNLTVDEHIKLTNGRNVLRLTADQIEELSLDDFGYIHGGWHERFTGSNNPTPEQHLGGAKLYVKYLQEAYKNNCFPNSKGVGFFVEKGVNDYKARSWRVDDSGRWSWAADGYGLLDRGRFLRVRGGVAAEGGDALKINPAFAQAYDDMVKGANVLHLPGGICYVRTHGQVNG